MGYKLEEQPNSCGTPQMRKPRRRSMSGCVSVHTAESIVDTVGPDTGAENVADFICRRCDYGSYHELVDGDSFVAMAPDDAETWNVAASLPNGYGHNSHIWGISAACRATDWNPDDDWTRRTIDRMGERIAAFWIRNGFADLAANPRWLTKEEADAEQPGLILHGSVQPWDRSDAWRYHPRRSELDDMLLDAIRRHGGGTPTEPDGSLTMSDVQTILDELGTVKRRIDDQDATLGSWMHDTRKVLENAMGAATLQIAGEDEQWLLVGAAVEGGIAKVHVKDPTTLALLVKAQVVRQGQAGEQFQQVQVLTDPVEQQKLRDLPTLG